MRIEKVRGVWLLIHERVDWQILSRGISGPSSSPGLVETEVCHYPGNRSSWVPPKDVASHIRWMQDLYLNDRGYSLGYCWVIGPNEKKWTKWADGRDVLDLDIWEVRGRDFRNAANGPAPKISWTDNFNRYSDSIQIMCSDSHPPNEDQRLAFRYAIAMNDKNYREGTGGGELNLIGHQDVNWTACPGPAYSMIPQLAVRPPMGGSDIPEEEEVQHTFWRLKGTGGSWKSDGLEKTLILNKAQFEAEQALCRVGGRKLIVNVVGEAMFRAAGTVAANSPNPSFEGAKRDLHGVPQGYDVAP